MSHITIDLDQGSGPLSTYNSLTDSHLTGYFSSPRKRKHLRNVGLINRTGYLVSENTFRLNMARKEHKRHIKNTLAQAIVEKTLELERQRQNVIKQKLEEIAKLELVHRVRASEKRRRDVEDILPFLSPRSPRRPISGPAPSKPGGSPKGKYRPISAPENNRPESGSTKTSTNYDEDDDDDVEYLDENGRPISPPRNGELSHRNETVDFSQLYTLNTAALRKYAMTLARLEQNRGGSSPYVTTQIPIPPRSPRIVSSSSRSRRYNGTGGISDRSPTRRTANGQVYLHHTESITTHPGQLQSMVEIRMKYHGWNLSLARDEIDPRNLVVIEQQHCGGNTLTVYKEKLLPKSDFTFVSHRHRGYPFSLTIYVDGRMDSRVSTCCEYRHGKNVRLGGANGHFSFVNVKGNGPCYKCRVTRGGKKKKKQKSKPETATEEVTVVETYPVSENVGEEKDKQQNGKTESESEGQQIIVPVENGDETSRTNDNAKDIDTGNYDDDFEDSDAETKEKKNDEIISDDENVADRRGHESRRKHKKTKRSGNLGD